MKEKEVMKFAKMADGFYADKIFKLKTELDILIGLIQRNTTLQASNISIYKDKVTGYRNKLFEQAMKVKRHLSTLEKPKEINSSFIQDCLIPDTKHCSFQTDDKKCTNTYEYNKCKKGSPK